MVNITRTERELQRLVAVLSPSGVLIESAPGRAGLTAWGRVPDAGDGMALHGLVDMAAAAGVRAVWVLPGSALAVADPSWWTAPDNYFTFASTADGATHPTAILCRNKAVSGGEVQVVDLARDHRWPWAGEAGAAHHITLAAIIAVETALGIPLAPGPGATGWQLVEHLNAGHPDWLVRPAHLDTWPRPADRAPSHLQPLDAKWATAPAKWVHLYDANGAYLAAAQSAPLGIGPVELSACFASKEAAGWHVTAYPGQSKMRPVAVDGWYDTASVRAALELGQPVKVAWGYVYPESHTILRSWADTLWRARSTTDDPLVREALKRVYVQTIGRMNHPPRSDAPAPVWHRPDWWAAIVGEWARRLVTKVGTLHATPWLIDTDTIGIVSDRPDPEDACPQLLTRRLGLGGYKHKLTLPLTANVVEASGLGSAGRCVRRLELLAAVK